MLSLLAGASIACAATWEPWDSICALTLVLNQLSGKIHCKHEVLQAVRMCGPPQALITTLMITCRRWYLEKFEDYPKNRRAVIPFIW